MSNAALTFPPQSATYGVMPDDDRTKEELIEELNAMRDRVSRLEQASGEEESEASEESEGIFRMAFENAPDGMALADTTSKKFRMANASFCRMLGYTEQEIVDLGVMDIHPKEHLPYIIDQFERQARGEISVARNLPVKRKDGSVFYADISTSVTKLSGRTYLLGICRDVTERNEAEQALLESEQKYRTLISNIPDITWTSDSEGNTTFVSSNIEKICGYTSREICEKGDNLWLGISHPDDLQRLKQAYVALFEKNVPFDAEYRIKRKDGQWIWLHDRSTATYEIDGRRYADGVSSDITVRKVVEMALRESQTNLAMAQQIAHVGSWDWDIETGAIAWSDEAYRLFGFDPGQVEPTLEFFMDAVHPADKGFVRNALDRAVSEGQPFHVEFRIIRADGVERILDSRGRILYDGRGKPLRMLGAVQDITGRKRAEQRQVLRLKVLETFHQQGSLTDMCGSIISMIKAHLNCEAVALRMKEGDDYPYFVNDGFEPEFTASENYLCCHDETGGQQHAPNREPVLACMCGVVIKGGADDDKPYFTSKGSFWTNSTTLLLASTTAENRGATTRNACNRHGYESVALIRIDANGDTIGLLQVNAKRKNLFSTSRLQFLEELGQLIGIAAERRKAELALEQSEEKFRRITEQGFDVVFTAELDGTLTYASPSAKRVYGYSPEEMIGKNASEFISESSMPNMIQQFKEIAEGKSFENREIEIRRKDGSKAVIEVNATPIYDGEKLIGAQASARDITERKRTIRALRESEENYRTLVESAGESIASIDENGMFLFMNTTGADRLGGKPEDYVGKTMWDLFSRAHADRQMASIRKVLEKGHGTTFTSLTELKGQLRWHSTTIEPLRKVDIGSPTGVMVIARDIHDARLAEEELANYRERMAHTERLASLGTLSATAAHELTQPLTVIRLSLDNLLDDLRAASAPEDFTRKLENSLAEVSNITAIIDRFRSFARKSSETTMGPVNLQAVAEKIVMLLSAGAQRARVKLSLDDIDKLPFIYGNEKDMEQLFFALFQNAIQAADGEKARELVVAGAVKDRHVELRFADTCGGIAPENIDVVFEPFFTTKPPGQGTGLGLCIVQQIAARTGGKVSIESEFGKGTTFFVALPVARD